MRTILTWTILGVVLWFSITNVDAITLHLLFWQVTASTALIIFFTFLLGFLFGVVRLAPGLLKKSSSLRSGEHELTKLKNECAELKKEIIELRNMTTSKETVTT